jgi:hypothetical protein
MDRLERLRYQTADRRKQLLDEMIDVELLAREAERRGLSERAETKELVRQILRAEVLADLRDKVPAPEDVPASEVRAYYEAHHEDFREPERRRVAHISLPDRVTAEKVLAEARSATPKRWGELVRMYSVDRPSVDVPDELAGDLGLLTAPKAHENDNGQASEAVRAAAFEIPSVGAVLDHVVPDGGIFHVLRLIGKNDARDRSLAEADRAIRVHLVEERMRKAQEDLGQELRARYPVRIDTGALAKVPVPDLGKQP